jgi:hypothetical protein
MCHFVNCHTLLTDDDAQILRVAILIFEHLLGESGMGVNPPGCVALSPVPAGF